MRILVALPYRLTGGSTAPFVALSISRMHKACERGEKKEFYVEEFALLLHSGVELPLVLGGVLPLVGLRAGDLGDQILAQNGPALRLLHQVIHRGGQIGGDDAVERACVPQPAGDGACVHICNACASTGQAQ